MMKRKFPRNLVLLVAAALFAVEVGAHAQLSGRHQKLALSSETDPSGKKYGNINGSVILNNGLTTFYHVPGFLFNPPRLYQGTVAKVDRELDGSISAYAVNTLGEIVFEAFFNGGTSIFLASPAGIKNIALEGDAAPGGGVFNSFPGDYCVNDSGKVAFHAFTTGGPGEGMYLQTGTGIVSVALASANAPDGGVFADFGSRVWVNNAGQVVFSATTSGGAGGGVYLATASTPSVLLSNLHPSEFTLNNAGQVAFAANGDIHLATTAGDTVIVNNGDSAPGGGTFSSFDSVALNQAGQVAFHASTSNGPGGLYLWTTNGLTSIALNNAPAPGGSTFISLGKPVLNNAGQVVFTASTGGGDMICFVDGTNLFKVASVGDSLLGVTISGVDLGDGLAPLNDLGQVAYFADFSNGVRGLFIFTPGPHWLAGGNGTWDTAANWTDGIEPVAASDAAIDPATAATVTGPAANTTVRTLVVGGGAGAVTLKLQPTGILTTTAGTSVAPNGTLAGAGTIGGNLSLFPGARIALQLGGLVRGIDYDFLKVTGKSVLTGTLNVTVANGLTLHGRDTFDLFDWGARSGNFVAVNLPTLAPGLTWDTSKLYTTGVVTVSMATFFAANQGKYAGLVSANPSAFVSTGALALKLDQGGGLSGTLKMGGKSYPVHGAFDDAGFFSGALGTSGFALSLQLDLMNATDRITATITQNGQPFGAATIDRLPTGFTKTNPVARAGTYTVALPADPAHPEAAYPQGAGYGSLVVAPTGAVKLTGVLGDFTTASPAGVLSKNHEFSVYLPLYGGKGYLSGVLTLRDAAAANHVEGTLHWFKPTTKAKAYPASFSGDIAVAGSRYTAPPLQPQILPAGATTFTISEGNVTTTPTKNLTVAVGNVVTNTGADKFSLKFTTKTGIFGGTFLDADSISRAFKGAFLQKQNVGKGAFKGVNQTGKIELQPQ